jgi:hypothetical protein
MESDKLVYQKRKEEFDKKFKILVEKGGLPLEVYKSHRQMYCLGYYKSF